MTIKELQKAIEPLMKYELFTVRQMAFLLKLQLLGGNAESGAIRKSLGIGRPAMSSSTRFTWHEASHHSDAQRQRPALLQCKDDR